MTFPAANLGFFDILVGFTAVGTYTNLVRKEWKRPF